MVCYSMPCLCFVQDVGDKHSSAQIRAQKGRKVKELNNGHLRGRVDCE